MIGEYKGIIWIRNTAAGSKSDGNKAYFIDSEFNHYQLYRKGAYEINDTFFYPYHLTSVQVKGEIQNKGWIMVESVDYIDAPGTSITNTKNI